jgi:lactoylglutathione lyase
MTMPKAVFMKAVPYAADALNLPVENIDTAIPYYEKKFGFRVVSRQETPFRSVILGRDHVQIGLAENGGDSSQEGCFFEVDDLAAAFAEIKREPPADSSFRLDEFDGVPIRVFFEIAPDGLCYMLGERQT